MPQVTPSEALRLAIDHRRAGRSDDAEVLCRQILAADPDQPGALNLLAVLAAEAGEIQLATQLLRRAIALEPVSAEFRSNLGNLYRATGQTDAAIEAYRTALRIDPRLAEVHTNLGTALAAAGQFDDAVAAHRAALSLDPRLLQAHSNLGNALTDMGRVDEAIAAYRDALALNPDHPEVHTNLAMCLLLNGDYPAGFREYEWRLRCTDAAPVAFSEPLWTGEPLAGGTILLHAEQGLGDALQFIRYVPLVAGRVPNVVVQCPPPLVPLLGQTPSATRWIAPGEPRPPFDVHCPLLSLPFRLGTTLAAIPPPPDPPLRAAADRIGRWRGRVGLPPSVRKIGLAWAGNPDNKNDRNRSIPLARLAPLLAAPGCRFVSLQVGAGADDARRAPFDSAVVTPEPPPGDFADTAALIANVDLVITVDTAVAHLAGSMHVPTWVLLPFAPDWRWMLGRVDSPWYPAVRLFRQPRPGDWDAAVAAVARALSAAHPI